ncbi:MAG: hypothetical protein KDI43_17500, partial [Gammaproteobacteria bacterium]|nr:hypothetical protein [Gammaproteobacteria bacterium]
NTLIEWAVPTTKHNDYCTSGGTERTLSVQICACRNRYENIKSLIYIVLISMASKVQPAISN